MPFQNLNKKKLNKKRRDYRVKKDKPAGDYIGYLLEVNLFLPKLQKKTIEI